MASSKLTLTADSGGTAAIQPAAALSTAINLTLPTLGGNLIAANSAIGTSGQVITTDGANIYWAAGGGGGSITINNDTTTATAEYPLFSSTNSGSLSTAYTSSGNLTFKPSNGLLTAVNMAASQGILYTANTISTTVTLPTGYNGVSAGAVSVTGSVSVPAGSTWVVDSGAGSGLTASNNTWTGTNAFNNGVSLANIVSAAVSGTITAPTPAQFDNDTSVATTAFVQRALGSYSKGFGSSGSTTLTAAESGAFWAIGGAGGAVTLPSLASTVSGTSIKVASQGAALTVSPAGADTLWLGTGLVANVSLALGDYAEFTNFNGSTWYVTGGTPVLKTTSVFQASLGGNGYQKLPSGLIIQWGAVSVSASSGTATYSLAFPTACVSITATPFPAGYFSYTVATSVGGASLTQFTWNSALAFSTGVSGFTYMAIGY